MTNDDIRFFQPWAEPMITLAESDPRIGVVGPRLLYWDDMTIQHAGMPKSADCLEFHHRLSRLSRTHPEACANSYMWSVTGALFMIKRSAARVLGGLSTFYGMAWEDVDYCLRAWACGFRVAYCGETEIYHGEGKTRGANEAEKRKRPLHWSEWERAGRAYFHRKWFWMTDLDDFPQTSQETVWGSSAGTQGWRPPISARDGASGPAVHQNVPSPLVYSELVQQIREIARTSLPDNGLVLVVSKGDDALLQLNGCRAGHFPQGDNGAYAGYYPADSAQAIAHLEALRAKGGEFILFPQTSFWWLDYYPEFRQYLESRGSIVRQDDRCIIFALRAEADAPQEGSALEHGACHDTSEDGKWAAYFDLTARLQERVTALVPREATVIVVSKGDDALLNLNGRRTWHFPQQENGEYAGYYPEDSAAAIDHLEALHRKGGDFLLVPAPALWWLDHYDGFRQHLETRYQRTWSDPDGVLFTLAPKAEAASGDLSTQLRSLEAAVEELRYTVSRGSRVG